MCVYFPRPTIVPCFTDRVAIQTYKRGIIAVWEKEKGILERILDVDGFTIESCDKRVL